MLFDRLEDNVERETELVNLLMVNSFFRLENIEGRIVNNIRRDVSENTLGRSKLLDSQIKEILRTRKIEE